jgi:hypothetical protein
VITKRVSIWLTHAESKDVQLQASLKPLYREFKAERFLVAVYESGTEDLEELTKYLLEFNAERIAEEELRFEQGLPASRSSRMRRRRRV